MQFPSLATCIQSYPDTLKIIHISECSRRLTGGTREANIVVLGDLNFLRPTLLYLVSN